jgi:ribosomal protein S18 acetylase RimI-like enzyme
MPVSLRRVQPADEEFLFELFCQTMDAGLMTFNTAQRDGILRLQFKAQLGTYNTEFPHADHQIIMLDDQVIGRVMVERTSTEHRGVDIALLRDYRSGGIGTMLIGELLEEASKAGKPFRISVVRSNPAIHLYVRLGFKVTDETATHLSLEWSAPSKP